MPIILKITLNCNSHLSLPIIFPTFFYSYSHSQIIGMEFTYRVSHRSYHTRQAAQKPRGTLGILLRLRLEGYGDIQECWLLRIPARWNVCYPRDVRKHNLSIWYADRYHSGNVNIHILPWQRPARDCRSVLRSSTLDVSRTRPSSDSRRAATCSPTNHACVNPRARRKDHVGTISARFIVLLKRGLLNAPSLCVRVKSFKRYAISEQRIDVILFRRALYLDVFIIIFNSHSYFSSPFATSFN